MTKKRPEQEGRRLLKTATREVVEAEHALMRATIEVADSLAGLCATLLHAQRAREHFPREGLEALEQLHQTAVATLTGLRQQFGIPPADGRRDRNVN